MQDFITSLRSILLLWLLTALIYPLVILGIGQAFLPERANGSLIADGKGQIVGSALIGQIFTSEQYFWSRPSAVNYSEGDKSSPTGVSGASNLAPGNPQLLTRIQQDAQRLASQGTQPTADLLYSSGSGLDPHISPEAAKAQIERVARVRSLSAEELQTLVANHTDGRFLGIFGEPGVNVLTLNLALDSL